MAVKLNLLPEEFLLKGPLGRAVKFVRPLTITLLALFLIMALGMGAFFIFSSFSLKNLQSSNDTLTNQIQVQAAAQQQIVLLKDRLAKIKTVQSIPTATKNLVTIEPILSALSGSSLISELDIDSQKTTTSVVFKSNSDLTNFVKSLQTNTAFSLISIGSFNYSPATGYQLGLTFTAK